MNKNIFAFLVLCILLLQQVQSFAQNINIGVTAGPNFSIFHGSLNETASRKFRVGVHAGLAAHIYFSGDWSIRAEVLYSQQGGLWSDGPQTKYTIKNDYLSIPFLLDYKFNDRLSIEFGPGIGILLKSEEIVTYPAYEDVTNTKDNYNLVDIGLFFGARYSFGEHFSTGLRYYNGLMWVEVGANRRINAHFQIPISYYF